MKKRAQSILFLFTILCSWAYSQDKVSDQVYFDSLRLTQSDSMRGWAYLQLAKSHTWKDKELANSYVDSAEMYRAFTDSEEAQASIMFTKANILRAERKNAEAKVLLEEALSIYEKGDNKYMTYTVQYSLGAVALGMGNSLESAQYFHDGLKLSREENDSLKIAGFLNGLGVIQRRSGDLQSAKPYYEEALAIYEQKDHTQGMSTCLLNLAIIENRSKNYPSALSLYEKALVVANRSEKPSPVLIGSINGNISSVYSNMKDYDKAIEYGEISLALRKDNSEMEELFNAHLGLGINYSKVNKLSKAQYHFDNAERLTEDNDRSLYQLRKEQSNLYFKQNKYRDAYEKLEQSYEHKDSIYNKEKAEQIDQLNVEFETERKEAEISQLKLQDELKQSQITKQRIGLIAALGGLGMLGFFLFRLRAKNQEIEKQNKEKETLLKEIHHRVKNNLQMISSLLGLQGLSVKDPKAKIALEEGRTRVHSMSLIHQNLYKENDLTGIHMPTYLKKLGNDLVNTYHFDDKEISMGIQSEDLTLDVESVVPIGLIVNELITNSLKYAFDQRDKGKIEIHLKESQKGLILTVLDDGVGLSSDLSKPDNDGFGHSLIRAFRSKLDADIEIEGETGTVVRIIIKNYKKVA